MARWPRGEADVERLVGLGHLQHVTGAAADGTPLLAKARRTLATAESVAPSDPDSAFVLAYDAARYAATALLAHQGLRPTTAGGHVTRLRLGARVGRMTDYDADLLFIEYHEDVHRPIPHAAPRPVAVVGGRAAR